LYGGRRSKEEREFLLETNARTVREGGVMFSLNFGIYQYDHHKP